MSQTSICNQALTSLGAKEILSINDNTTEARLCKLHYQPTLNSLLEMASWTFATVTIPLPRSAESAPPPYTSKFLIPVNILRVIEASEDPNFNIANTTYWQIQGEYIVSDSAEIYIRAIRNDIDTNAFTPTFHDAFVARLAAEMSLAITQSNTTSQEAYAKAGNLLQMAVTMDSSQGRTRPLRSSKYLNARRGRGGYYFVLREQE